MVDVGFADYLSHIQNGIWGNHVFILGQGSVQLQFWLISVFELFSVKSLNWFT